MEELVQRLYCKITLGVFEKVIVIIANGTLGTIRGMRSER